MAEITIQKPDDWHLHFRDDDMLGDTVPATARCFQRAVVMPNLVPPVANAEMAMAYRERIKQVLPAGSRFEPLMTLFLTNGTSPDDIRQARAAGIFAAKLYPAGGTTNSDAAPSDLAKMSQVFTMMQEVGMPLLVHGEVIDPQVDIFDREKIFIDRYLQKIVHDYPGLKVVMEHITTKDAVQFVAETPKNVAATITPQHLLLNRNDLLVGGIRPHNYCLPVLKRSTHQEALRNAVVSGSTKYFLGTDSAPHEKQRKENACGCAGCYSAWSALELYTQVFDELNVLDKLEGFASVHGADFYGLPHNQGTVTLVKETWIMPEQIILQNGKPIVPFFAGREVHWKVKNCS